MTEKTPRTAWQQTLAWLNRRALNRRQLTGKLRTAGFPAAEIREAVERAEKSGFVNDELLAESYARFVADSGLGRFRIRQKLKSKEFDPGTVERALAPTEEDERERALLALDYKLRCLPGDLDPRKKREKLFRFLVGRGFPLELVREVVRSAPIDAPEDAEANDAADFE